MALIDVCHGKEFKIDYFKIRESYDSEYEPVDRQASYSSQVPDSRNIIQPCYYIMHLLGIWRRDGGRLHFVWAVYRRLVFALWLAAVVVIMSLSFVHYGFTGERIRVSGMLNDVCTCVDLLCPYVFTLYYFKCGQFVQLVSSVQNESSEWRAKLTRLARFYTVLSMVLWAFCASFFMIHWFPFFSKPWHYAVYITVIVFTTGWWGTWLTIYGFVCHVHVLQIDIVVEEMKSRSRTSAYILRKHSRLLTCLERTQKDFNVMISSAVAYHIVDLIIFSFAYFNSAFGRNYPIWQFAGTILFDITSIIFKLYPPALVAAAVHRIVTAASRRCRMCLTHLATDLPREEILLYQYISLCETDMGLKILGIRITVQLSMKLLMAIVTAGVSFITFLLRLE